MKLNEQVERNEAKILTLEIENDAKKLRIEKLEENLEKQNNVIERLQNKANESEQYSRRNCLRLFGVEESKGENTDEVVMRIVKDKLNIDLPKSDIDRSHRTGSLAQPRHATRTASQDNSSSASATPTATSSSWASKASSNRAQTIRPRPIIIKFATYRARQVVIKARSRLKNSGLTIVEDLTKANYAILRKVKSSSKVSSVWSQDGRIIAALPTTNGIVKKVITSMEEANKL